PFRQWISLSYLLCRVLDTVEDAPWNSQEEQQKSFTAFEHFLSHSDVTALRIWQERFPTQIPDGEIKLLADSELLFQDLHQLPEEIREVIID
ncbi:hypothetical protein, partial [Pseudomonas protegens]|uniref:hypothetical protein n=1 Tax=Pseudomonas protegens TaxID=380021 RepID=UPI000CD3A81F